MKIQLSDHFTYRRLGRFVLPSIIMMVFTSIYSVVDGLFVSNFVGTTAFAAVNLIMPFIMIIGSVGFMIGTGGSALVGRTLGMGDKKLANQYFSMMVIFTLIISVILSAIGVIFMRIIASKLGATGQMLEDAVLYGRIMLISLPMFMLLILFESFLVTAEKPKLGLTFTVLSGVCNVILDVVFIVIFKWGLLGAALATAISQSVGGLIPFFYFTRPNTSLLRFKKTKLQARPILKACANGSSEMMSNISASIVGVLYNFQLLRLAGEKGVAAYGVLMYVNFAFLAIFIGYIVGAAPIISYHFGYGNKTELKSIVKKSLVVMAFIGLSMLLLAQWVATPLSKIFVGYDQELFEMTRIAFKIFSLAFIITGVNIFISSMFTALNNGGISAFIAFMRTLVFQLLSVLLLPLILGIEGIWWAAVVAEVLALLVSFIFFFKKKKHYGY